MPIGNPLCRGNRLSRRDIRKKPKASALGCCPITGSVPEGRVSESLPRSRPSLRDGCPLPRPRPNAKALGYSRGVPPGQNTPEFSKGIAVAPPGCVRSLAGCWMTISGTCDVRPVHPPLVKKRLGPAGGHGEGGGSSRHNRSCARGGRAGCWSLAAVRATDAKASGQESKEAGPREVAKCMHKAWTGRVTTVFRCFGVV